MNGRCITVGLVALSIGLLGFSSPGVFAQGSYSSPFSITLDPAITAWTSDFSARQAAIDANTTPSMTVWYSSTTSYVGYPYGPLNPQLYSSGSLASPGEATALQYDRGHPVLNVTMNAIPGGVDPTTWQQQRVMAAANVLLQAGTHYQHLHMPNFNPAQVTSGTGFPWIPVSTNANLQSSWQLSEGVSGTTPNPYAAAYGQPEPGIDCTDFSAYVYSLALGVQMHSGTPDQIQFTGGKLAPGATATATVLDTTGTPITPQFFYRPNFGQAGANAPGSLNTLVSQFQPGDLLYMGNPTDGILHVVMWLGQTGTDSAGNTFPLVISSHDNTPAIFDTLALDAEGYPSDGNVAGHLPPPGVHILPFASSNWFYQDFQVAMRVTAVPEPGTVVLAALGLIVAGSWRHRSRGRGMRRRRHESWAIVLFSIVAAAPCWAQGASPPEPTLDVAVQEGPGEGDEGESESIDEAIDAKPYDGPYRSPYRFTFKAPLQELLFDADEPRGSPREQSSVPFREWYTAKARHEWGSWGVPTKRFDCPARVMQKPAEWRRERVVAAAGRFIGYQYQHHHVPDWNPPADWPWKQCCAGHNGPGIDCSNFSGWNYNWALGIHLKTGIQKQAAAKSARSSQGEVHAHVIERPEGEPRDWYDSLVDELRPGDLLYIGNKSRTKVTHVIMWVGKCGSSPNGTPLIIDSTGSSHKDSNGHAIPCGIHLRPFEKGSWYHESFNHAHRWVK